MRIDGSRGDRSSTPRGAPEYRLAASAAKLSVILAIPTIAVAWLAAGMPGLVGAAAGVALVCVLWWVSAVIVAMLARRGGAALIVGGYASFVVRLGITAVVLAGLRTVDGLHLPSLVLATIALMLAALAYECWHLAHTPELHWLEPRTERTRA